MLHLEAEWPSKLNILIADTLLAEQARFSGPWLNRRQKVYCWALHVCAEG